MAGHLAHKTYGQAADEIGLKVEKLLQFMSECDSLHAKYLRLWRLHGNDDGAVAAQLFGKSEAAAQEIELVRDLKAALQEAHRIVQDADLDALRIIG